MKVTKLIIPLLGVSSITNANKQELLQLEKAKELDVSYQVLVVENEPDYFDITTVDTNITENLKQNEVGGPKQEPAVAECWEIFNQARRICDGLWGPAQVVCYVAASTALAACLAAT